MVYSYEMSKKLISFFYLTFQFQHFTAVTLLNVKSFVSFFSFSGDRIPFYGFCNLFLIGADDLPLAVPFPHFQLTLLPSLIIFYFEYKKKAAHRGSK